MPLLVKISLKTMKKWRKTAKNAPKTVKKRVKTGKNIEKVTKNRVKARRKSSITHDTTQKKIDFH